MLMCITMYNTVLCIKSLYMALILHCCCAFGSSHQAYVDIYPSHGIANQSIPLYFGLMLSLSGDQQSTGALSGVQAALDDINNRDDLLPGYSLHYTLTDSKVNLYMCGHVGNPAMNCNATVQ